MTEYTLTFCLSDDQQRQLEEIAEAYNQHRSGEKAATAAQLFNTIMQTGSAHVIDERLKFWREQLHIDG